MVATDIKSIAKEANGFISIASEAVKVAPEYQNIIGNLLGNTIIVDHLKHANELARAIKYRTRIVTLEGDIVNPGGSMTGGGARKSKVFYLKRRVDNNETPIRRLLASNRII